MNAILLREYVSLMIEKIRTAKNSKSKFGERFDLKKFKALDSAHMMLVYANQYLEPLGEGSSRRAFTLSSKYALKIALNEKGIAQNEAELDVFTNPKTKGVVAKIYGADNENRWVISDLVKPLQRGSEDEFAQITGTDWEDFRMTLRGALKGEKVWPDEFTQSAITVAKSNNLVYGDLGEIGHWGKTPDGRCVLLDYGFTEGVWNDHYKSKQPEPEEKDVDWNAGLDWGDVQADLDGKSKPSKTRSPSPAPDTSKDKKTQQRPDKTKQAAPQDARTAKPKKNPAPSDASTAGPKRGRDGDTKRVPYKPDDDERTRR